MLSFVAVCLVSLAVGGVHSSSEYYLPPVDCAFSVWSAWTPHSSGTYEIRTRHIIRHARNGGAPCRGETVQRRTGQEPPAGPEGFLQQFLAGNAPSYSLGGGNRYTLSRDIVFLLDTTIPSSLFPYYKSLVSNLVGKICGDIGSRPQDTRLGILKFASYVNEVQRIADGQPREITQDQILRIQSNSDVTRSNLITAIQEAKSILTGANQDTRPYNNATKEVFIVTPYSDICSRALIRQANRLKSVAEVFVVLLGEGNNWRHGSNTCLQGLASEELTSHFLHLNDISEISAVSQRLLAQSPVNRFCSQSNDGLSY